MLRFAIVGTVSAFSILLAEAVGSDEIWEKAEGALKEALQAKVRPPLSQHIHCSFIMTCPC